MALPVLFLFLFPCESHREAYPLARGTHILLNVLLPEEKAMDNDFLKVLAFASALPCLIEDSGPRRGALKGAGSIFSQYIGRQQWVQMWWVSVEKQILKRVAEETKVSARQGITSESKPGKGGKGCWGMRGKIMMLPRQRSTCLCKCLHSFCLPPCHACVQEYPLCSLLLTQILPSVSSCVSLGIYGRGCVADTQTTNTVQADFSPTGMLQLLRNFVLSYLTCSCYCSNWCLWLHKATAKKYDFIYLKYLYARGCVLLQDVISFWLFCRAQAIVTQIISL